MAVAVVAQVVKSPSADTTTQLSGSIDTRKVAWVMKPRVPIDPVISRVMS